MNVSDVSLDVDLTTSLLIHWALFAMIFVYGGLAFGVSPLIDKPITDPSTFRLIAAVIGLVSLLVLCSVYLFRSTLLSPESLTQCEAHQESEAQYATGVIIQGALLESVAIYGLLLSMLSSSPMYFVPFALISLFLMIVIRPSRQDFEHRLELGGWTSDKFQEKETQ